MHTPIKNHKLQYYPQKKTRMKYLTFSLQSYVLLAFLLLVSNNNIYSQADAGSGQSACSSTFTLTASDPAPGTGKWTIKQGSGMFDNSSLYNTTVEAATGENIFAWTVIDTNGNSTSDEVTITNNLEVAYAGEDVMVETNEVTLNAYLPVYGSGLWSVVNSIGSFANETLYNTEVTGMSVGINTFSWTVTNNGCVSSDEVTVIYYSNSAELVARYEFEGTTVDESENDNSAINHNVTFQNDVCGSDNMVAEFDGSDSYLEIKENSLLETTAYTFACWLNSYKTGSGQMSILNYGDGGTVIGIDSEGYVYTGLAGSSSCVVQSENTLTDKNWTWILCTRDTDNNTYLYLNGELQDVVSCQSDPTYNNTINIGRNPSSKDEYFHGGLEDILWYRRYFTEVEAKQLYIDAGGFYTDFSVDNAYPGVAEEITFDDNTVSSFFSLTYDWDFGDGSNSDIPDPTYAYSTAGIYTVSLTATAIGCNISNTVVKDDFIVVTEETLSSNAYLQQINIDNSALDSFSADVYSYISEIPTGTGTYPDVEGIPDDEYATVVTTQALDNNGTAIIDVTATDGTSTARYTVEFYYNKNLSSISVNGSLLDNFDSETTVYSFELEQGTTQTPIVFASTEDPACSSSVSNATDLRGTLSERATVITVTAPDGTQKEYSIVYSVISGTNATLSDITINGVSINDFDASVTSYTYDLPYNTAVFPEVDGTTTDQYASVNVTEVSSLEKTITVTAEDGTTQITYTVTFNLLSASEDATLSSISVNGTKISPFHPAITGYSYIVLHGTTAIPTVTATTTYNQASITITDAQNIDGTQTERTTSILVKAQNGTTTKTYTIVFSLAPNDDATLSDLKINGATVTGFNSSTYTYSYELPRGTTTIPTVSATANDHSNATVIIIDAIALRDDVANRTTTVRVTAEDGTTTLSYYIIFSVKPNSDATLSEIYIEDELLDGFSTSTYVYSVELPAGTTTVPVVTVTTDDEYATFDITDAANLTGTESDRTTIIIVTAEDGSTTGQYDIIFTVLKSSDATLSEILINGVALVDFSSSVSSYSVLLDYPATSIPLVSVTPTDASATALVTDASSITGTSSERTTVINVTAEDGSTTATYYVIFSLDTPDNDATLQYITINGEYFSDFSSNTTSYEITLESGTADIPLVIAVTTDADAEAYITDATSLTGTEDERTTTIVVTAEDGSTTITYKLIFSVAKSQVVKTDDDYTPVYNYFSPNGDGVNDELYIENAVLYYDCDLYIYNEAGELLYNEKAGNADWDATYNGTEVPNGVYFYILKCDDTYFSGSITLLR